VLLLHSEHGNVAAQGFPAVHVHFGHHCAKAVVALEHQEAQVRPVVQKIPAQARLSAQTNADPGRASAANALFLPVREYAVGLRELVCYQPHDLHVLGA
jgi:hypothetical protein